MGLKSLFVPSVQGPTKFFIAVNNSPPWCEDIIFVMTTFHMSMELSFETQVYLKLTQNTTFQTPIPSNFL
jgi:hypothetical protein